jgi:hypothetical protein
MSLLFLAADYADCLYDVVVWLHRKVIAALRQQKKSA